MSIIYIITEGYRNTGYGHLTRCLGLAQGFAEKDVQAKLIVNCDPEGEQYLSDANVDSYDWIRNNERFYDQIEGAEIAVIDSYQAPLDVYEEVSNRVKLDVYIDDYLRLDYPRGIIINGSMGAEHLPYLSNPGVRYLLGKDYIMLRREFWDVHKHKTNTAIQNVLITFGGQDIADLGFRTLEALIKEHPSLSYHLVLSNHQEKPLEHNPRVCYYKSLNAGEMLDLMLKCDIAVSAAGQTINELMRVGIPTIAVSVADNQRNHAGRWAEQGAAIVEFWHQEDKLLEQVSGTFSRFVNQYPGTDNVCLDGQGVRRIAEYLLLSLETSKNRYQFREFQSLSEAALKMIWEWRNDPSIRKWMYSADIISWENHLSFVENLKRDTTKKYFLVDRNGVHIGVFDLIDFKDDRAEMGFYLSPGWQKKGIGREYYYAVLEYIFATLGLMKIYQYNRADNNSANALNDLFGFSSVAVEKEVSGVIQNYIYRELSLDTWAAQISNHSHISALAKAVR